MKLLLTAISIADKDPNFRGDSLAELHQLIDVAENSGLILWHDHHCFEPSFWNWGKRGDNTINWGGYGSSYNPSNEKYFKFQYPGDAVDSKSGKLVPKKGTKPLECVSALVLPEADTDGTVPGLLLASGASAAHTGPKGLKISPIVEALKKHSCNFLVTPDKVPAALAKELQSASSKAPFFTLPVGRVLPLLTKADRKPAGKKTAKPKAYSGKDDAKAFSKLKSLLSSKSTAEIDQGISLASGLEGAFDKLLEGIELKKGINAWTNDERIWVRPHITGGIFHSGYPQFWGPRQGNDTRKDASADAEFPMVFQHMGEELHLDGIPTNTLFTGSEPRRYALFAILNAAPEDCAAAREIRNGLVALYWKGWNPPSLERFTALKHLYLQGCSSTGRSGLVSLAVDPDGASGDPSWIGSFQGLRRLSIHKSHFNNFDFGFVEKMTSLREIELHSLNEKENLATSGLDRLCIADLRARRDQIPHLLKNKSLIIGNAQISKSGDQTECHDSLKEQVQERAPKNTASTCDPGTALPAKEISKIKKLLLADDPKQALEGLKLLRGQSAATFNQIFGKFDFTNEIAAGNWNHPQTGLGWNVDLFESLKKTSIGSNGLKNSTNPLSDCLKINLTSMAPEGCHAAEILRDGVVALKVPDECPIPVDLAGFKSLNSLVLRIDLGDPDCSHLSGFECLVSLKKLSVSFPAPQNSKLPAKLSLPLPSGIGELEVNACESHLTVYDGSTIPSLDFLTVPPSLKKLKVSNVSRLGALEKFKESPLAYLEIQNAQDTDLGDLPFKATLTSIIGTLPQLASLKGLESCPRLEELKLERESLKDINHLGAIKALRRIVLSSETRSYDEKGKPVERALPELHLSPIKDLPNLELVDLGAHPIADFELVPSFQSNPDFKLTGISVKARG